MERFNKELNQEIFPFAILRMGFFILNELPELRIFMEEFFPAYGKTLDELTKSIYQKNEFLLPDFKAAINDPKNL